MKFKKLLHEHDPYIIEQLENWIIKETTDGDWLQWVI
jgi:hypothetical protein